MIELKISLELLYHFSCGNCSKWWSIADITPTPGALTACPHCTHPLVIPETVTLGNGQPVFPPGMVEMGEVGRLNQFNLGEK